MSVYDLPAVNATLNALATLCLLAGYLFIRQGRRDAHRAAMVGALVLSALFLTSYLVYHYHVGSRPFTGEGWIRTVYFTVLITHVVLAIVIVPLVVITVSRALAARFDRHRRIARWTWPLWMYVSVTGVIVYLMLYQMQA
jgi:putative membrane protein